MKIFNKTSIKELEQLRNEKENRDNAVQALASELATEKVKSMQKDIVIQSVASEVANLKIEIMNLKGGN